MTLRAPFAPAACAAFAASSPWVGQADSVGCNPVDCALNAAHAFKSDRCADRAVARRSTLKAGRFEAILGADRYLISAVVSHAAR